MKNLWSDRDAEAAVAHYAEDGVNRDVALRVYTTRLLGGEPRLVLHGGGNTSVKTHAELLGERIDVICVKGSGWDMGVIEPPGLPAVRLEPLRRLRALDALSDEDMVAAQRRNLLDPAAPTPSVETLLHAFLPHAFVDHTHANAILALTDQPDGEALCRETFGGRVVVLPYIMPGFALAKATIQAYEASPDCVGMILVKHGIFTFGATARESYDRMIDLVTVAEERLGRSPKPIAAGPALPAAPAEAARIAPILRGLAARANDDDEPQPRFILEHRGGPDILRFAGGAEVERYGRAGVVTPDHAIRVKPLPLLLPPPAADGIDAFRAAARERMTAYADAYRAYFARNNARQATPKIPLDPVPRIIIVPGVGLFALGQSAKHARIAADVAEAAIDVVLSAEGIGRFESITEAETFDMEYWSLEQAKLGKSAEPRLARHVVVVTGGAGTIGEATAEAFAREGAEIALLDLDGDAVAERARPLGALAIACDLTKDGDVEKAFDRVCATYGGVDVVVSNAGAAWQGRIGEVDDAVLRRSFELNFFAHQRVAKSAVARMLDQGTGGVLLFNVSKQAVNPGRDFGPYGLPKAALLALVRQYALDYGDAGIRSCGVNADRIRSGMLTTDMIASRSAARGVTETDYMAGNLLHREVRKQDVAAAFVGLALASRTTGAIMTVDGGNMAAALR